jgi:hypothetical protein
MENYMKTLGLLLRNGGGSLLFLSCLLTDTAFAGGLPQTINLPGPRPVYSLNAPPQPAPSRRVHTPLPPQPAAVVHLNAPQTGSARKCRLIGGC